MVTRQSFNVAKRGRGVGEYQTPQPFFDALTAEFHFTLDAAATSKNAKCQRYFTKKTDGLKQSWGGERVFVNPPYGETSKWVKKAWTEIFQALGNRAELVVLLLPASTDTRWFHKWILPFAEIRFIKGRLKFERGNKQGASAPFPSMIVIFRRANKYMQQI